MIQRISLLFLFILLPIFFGCGSPAEPSELKKKFDLISAGESMQAVREKLGPPDSERSEVQEEAFESQDGMTSVPKGSTAQIWTYEEGDWSHVIWFADNNDAKNPQDVVYMNMSISLGPAVRIK